MKKKKQSSKAKTQSSHSRLPKNALSKLDLGQAFAEYDHVRTNPDVVVQTPALRQALDSESSKLFFVGRRGTGKTTITIALARNNKRVLRIYPQIFSPLKSQLAGLDFSNTHTPGFRTLIAAFRLALHHQLLELLQRESWTAPQEFSEMFAAQRRRMPEFDFDLACVQYASDLLKPVREKDDKTWLKKLKKVQTFGHALADSASFPKNHLSIVIDKVDDAWDGSTESVIYLVALMHAALEVSSHIDWARVLVFLRENVFERVRASDTEFARLETCVLGLDWTRPQLREMLERRMNLPFNTRLAVDGTTWQHFFAQPDPAADMIFEYCQFRPRDVLTYCVFAIENAQLDSNLSIEITDLQAARKRFSDTRLKDLGDEYSDNFPRIDELLSRFYGLGNKYTYSGADAFIARLLADDRFTTLCQSWFYQHNTPEQFITLLYNIGFWGFEKQSGPQFRSMGPKSTTPPPIGSSSRLVIHPTYCPALELPKRVISNLDDTESFNKPGLLVDLPEGHSIIDYRKKLEELRDDLKSLPTGPAHYKKFEEIVGQIIRLCFFHWLLNVQEQSRTVDGCNIRDWIASNRAVDGFWETVRRQYSASQVLWECKNYEVLDSGAFHQISYYLTKEIGRFGIIAFRGERKKKSYYAHLRRISSEKDALVILLGQRDLEVFIRQAMGGKVKDSHIQTVFDETIREIS